MRRRLLRVALLAVAALAGLGAWVGAGLPPRRDIRALATKNPSRTRLMEQREEEARVRGRKARAVQRFVPLAEISRRLIQAVISSEDQNFFGHAGVDWRAIQDSLAKDVEKRRFVRGGSTITQQLAKNLYFGTAKTPVRKLREVIVARWLEDDLTKARILALYLNVIEWGDGIYGCEAAARHWYGKPASALNETEAAALAAMIPNPRRINPRVAPERLARASRRVLWLMAKAGYIGRDVAGLGKEPPEEPVEEDSGADADVPSDAAEAAAEPFPAAPSPAAEPSPAPEPLPSPTPPPP